MAQRNDGLLSTNGCQRIIPTEQCDPAGYFVIDLLSQLYDEKIICRHSRLQECSVEGDGDVALMPDNVTRSGCKSIGWVGGMLDSTRKVEIADAGSLKFT